MQRGLLRAMAVLAGTLLTATALFAGNIDLTGHQADVHGFFGMPPSQLAAMVDYARARSTRSARPILTVDDHGSSDIECGGCDLTHDDSAHVDARSAALASFFDAARGMVGLSEADHELRRRHRDRDDDDDFVPAWASRSRSRGPFHFVRTACGTALGIQGVDGRAMQNFFAEPDNGGVDPAYCGVQHLGDVTAGTPEAVDMKGATIRFGRFTTTIATVPEPTSLTLLGLGLAGAICRRLRRS